GRCRYQDRILNIDYELATKSDLNISRIKKLRSEYEGQIREREFSDAWKTLQECIAALRVSMREDRKFQETKESLGVLKQSLGRLSGSKYALHGRLSEIYRGLLGLFWEGKASEIHKEVLMLREMLEEIELAAAQGSEELNRLQLDEKTLANVEKISRRYQPQ
ncbi:MAG: hypothetical protein ABIH23_13895, partial [bacterium]